LQPLTFYFRKAGYTAQAYIKVGLKWIEDNNLRTVLRRHIPALGPVVDKLDNAFKPWR
jgi:hypothetical protein